MKQGTARGQLTLDFLTGMAIFFVVVGFVFAFVPGLLSATDDDVEDPLVADRVANQLVDYHLGEPSTATLDSTCTVEFFDQSGSACGTFDTTHSLGTQLGIDDRYRVRVSLVDSNGATMYAVGQTYQSGEGSVVTAERYVTYAGNDALLVVEVW